MFATVRKAVGAFLGGATAATVVVVAGWAGVEVPNEVATAVATLLATFGAWLAKPNEVEEFAS